MCKLGFTGSTTCMLCLTIRTGFTSHLLVLATLNGLSEPRVDFDGMHVTTETASVSPSPPHMLH